MLIVDPKKLSARNRKSPIVWLPQLPLMYSYLTVLLLVKISPLNLEIVGGGSRWRCCYARWYIRVLDLCVVVMAEVVVS